MSSTGVTIFPATPERWSDVAAVFEDGGHARKCWCAYWYRSNKDYRAGLDGPNKACFEKLVADNREPGIIAYVDGEPAGWLSVAPRTRFDRLNRSKPLAPVDGEPVWAMNCFIVRKKFRRQGLVRQLIRGGIDFVRERGGLVVEAYPVDQGGGRTNVYDAFLGTVGAFAEHGFVEVARRLQRRPILRLEFDKAKKGAEVIRASF